MNDINVNVNIEEDHYISESYNIYQRMLVSQQQPVQQYYYKDDVNVADNLSDSTYIHT